MMFEKSKPTSAPDPERTTRDREIDEMNEFCPVGQRFEYLGIPMTVVRISSVGWPHFICHYTDQIGQFHSIELYYRSNVLSLAKRLP